MQTHTWSFTMSDSLLNDSVDQCGEDRSAGARAAAEAEVAREVGRNVVTIRRDVRDTSSITAVQTGAVLVVAVIVVRVRRVMVLEKR